MGLGGFGGDGVKCGSGWILVRAGVGTGTGWGGGEVGCGARVRILATPVEATMAAATARESGQGMRGKWGMRVGVDLGSDGFRFWWT